MRSLINRLLNGRIWPLFVKEFHEIKRNRRLVVVLVIPPTINIVLFGVSLNPEVSNLRLGVVDDSRTAISRELVSAFSESRSFRLSSYFASSDEMGAALSRGDLDAGLVIPFDFTRQRERHGTARVQFLVDAVNSNTAMIAVGYAGQIISAVNQKIAESQAQVIASPGAESVVLNVGGPKTQRARVVARIALLFNPGLRNSWFIVTGMIGTLLVLQGSLVSAASMVKEKEVGTIEQLLMTPAAASEIIIAKVAPIFALLSIDIALALIVSRIVFGVPMRGSLPLLFFSASLCILCGIGIGTIIATFTRSQTQAQLMGFFVNPPLALLSGATTPIEAMPKWMQPFTYFNPITHFGKIARGVMLKGVGLDVLYPHVLALMGMAILLVWVSAWRFRKQL